MKALHAITAVALCALAWGCTPQESRESGEKTTHNAHPADLKSATGKWVLEDEVVLKVKEIERDLVAFSEETGSDFTDPGFHALADRLDAKVKDVFKACTMPDGPAHDALHDFLVTLKQSISKLRLEDDSDKHDIFHELEDHLALFSQQFEN